MPAIHYREAREEDILTTVDLFFASLTEMFSRIAAVPPPLPDREHVETIYRHILRTGIFHVAEVDGRVGAICHAIVRDHLWFLSGFWTLPHLQNQRIGGPLLEQVWKIGQQSGARIFFTWSSSDAAAMASYMKNGMLPGYQILTFSGVPRELPKHSGVYQTGPLALSNAMELDEYIRATGREIDHRFLLLELGYQGREARGTDGRVVGYYYVNKGTIGPAAWIDEHAAEALMAAACLEAAEQAQQIRLMIPGVNHAAIRFALKSGLRLTAFSHLLTTSPFGRLEQYLASGPSLF